MEPIYSVWRDALRTLRNIILHLLTWYESITELLLVVDKRALDMPLDIKSSNEHILAILSAN